MMSQRSHLCLTYTSDNKMPLSARFCQTACFKFGGTEENDWKLIIAFIAVIGFFLSNSIFPECSNSFFFDTLTSIVDTVEKL